MNAKLHKRIKNKINRILPIETRSYIHARTHVESKTVHFYGLQYLLSKLHSIKN